MFLQRSAVMAARRAALTPLVRRRLRDHDSPPYEAFNPPKRNCPSS